MFQKQADADADGQSDMLEKAEMELTIKKLIEDRKADLKLLEIQTNAGLKNKDIDTKKQIAKEKKAAEVRAIFAYEARTRSNLVRVYQNLKLGHFLAAYKNMDGIETPLPAFVEIYR